MIGRNSEAASRAASTSVSLVLPDPGSPSTTRGAWVACGEVRCPTRNASASGSSSRPFHQLFAAGADSRVISATLHRGLMYPSPSSGSVTSSGALPTAMSDWSSAAAAILTRWIIGRSPTRGGASSASSRATRDSPGANACGLGDQAPHPELGAVERERAVVLVVDP